MSDIRRVGVVGAGTMGSGIAALVAARSLPVVLLDVDRPAVPDGTDEALVETGSTEEHLARLGDCDLVVEAIVEHQELKRALFARLDAVRGAQTIVATNTSSIPIGALAAGRSASFRAHFLGLHFFNPVKAMRLVEVIAGADTDPAVVARAEGFARDVLGKGVVRAKDAPGFIANRLGVFVTVETLRLMDALALTIEEVDALTGPLLGRPASATFRTGDLVGLDVTQRVARELGAATGEDFALPAWVDRMVREGRLGAKAGGGYYRKNGEAILVIDPATMEYRARNPLALPALDAALALPLAERLRAAVALPERNGEFVRRLLGAIFDYTRRIAPDVAFDEASVDRAMEWGRGWEAGPFAMMRMLEGG